MAYPQLPSGSGMQRGSRPSPIRDVWGRGASGFRSLGHHISRTAGGLIARPVPGTPANSTLGNLVSSQMGPGLGAGGMGALDESPLADWLSDKTGGWIKPSHLAVGFGMLLRGTGVDRNYLGHGFSTANAALIRGMLPVWFYGMGGRAYRKVAGGVSMPKNPPMSGTPNAEQKPAPEPIPGEATVA